MSYALNEYCSNRLLKEAIVMAVRNKYPIEMHGLHPALIEASTDWPWETLEQVQNSRPYPTTTEKRFNTHRPVYYIATSRDSDKRRLIMMVMPSSDYLRHYASVLDHYLLRMPDSPRAVVYEYPSITASAMKWTGFDSKFVQPGDTVLVGFVDQVAKFLVSNTVGWEYLSTHSNQFYESRRYRVGSRIVNFIGVAYSYWGDMSTKIVREALLMGAVEIIYVAKLGTLTDPKHIYERIFSPTEYCVLDRNQIRQFSELGAAPTNPFAKMFPHTNTGRHCSVPTILEETYDARDIISALNVSSIDNELAQMAIVIRDFNSAHDKKVPFVPVMYATDYLRRREEQQCIVKYDLTMRNDDTARAKAAILAKISHHLMGYLYSSPSRKTADLITTFSAQNLHAVIVGTGYGSKTILPTLKRHKINIIGLIGGNNHEKTREIANAHGVHVDLSLEDYRRAGANLVFIASPHVHHEAQVMEALQLGLHVVCEKPLALPRALHAVLHLSQEFSGQLKLINHPLRFYRPFVRVKGLIDGRALGKIQSITMKYETSRLIQPNLTFNWWFDQSLGGGMILAMGTHLMDLVAYWTGHLPDSNTATITKDNTVKSLLTTSGRLRSPDVESSFVFHGTAAFTSVMIMADGASNREHFSIHVIGTDAEITFKVDNKEVPICEFSPSASDEKIDLVCSTDTQSVWKAAFNDFIGTLVESDVNNMHQRGTSFELYTQEIKSLLI